MSKKPHSERLFTIKPLHERNWLAMLVALVLCCIVILAAWPLAMMGEWYWWLVIAVMALASLFALAALITGDTEYLLIGVLVRWWR